MGTLDLMELLATMEIRGKITDTVVSYGRRLLFRKYLLLWFHHRH